MPDARVFELGTGQSITADVYSVQKVLVWELASSQSTTQSSADDVSYTAQGYSNGIQVTFVRAVVESSALLNSSNWTLTAPSGTVSPTISSVGFLSTTQVFLTSSGNFVNSGSYSVTLVSGTAYAQDDRGTNLSTTVAFLGVGTAATVSSVSAPSLNSVRFSFSQAVRQGSSGNTDSALRLANYVITDSVTLTPLTITDVVSVNASTVDVITSLQVSGRQYDWVVSNVKDITGNLVI